jgi:hypothetical protein
MQKKNWKAYSRSLQLSVSNAVFLKQITATVYPRTIEIAHLTEEKTSS